MQHVQEKDVIIATCPMCIEYYSPELIDQIVRIGGNQTFEDYQRVWFSDPAHLPVDLQAIVDFSDLQNQSPTYHFVLYVAELPGD